ncbi:MAG TPA: aldehyde dehydrogenase family protein [Bacteroidetes bacterium]|nr:aldehyde dehydrogenase family protein [Bacteroidota bacterium]
MDEVRRFLVGKEWRDSVQSVGVIDPYSGEEIAQVYYAGEQDVEDAVRIARASFEENRRLPAYERANLLYALAKRIEENRDDLAKLIMQEAGKPIRYAYAEVDRAVQTVTLSAEAARHLGGESLVLEANPQSAGFWGLTRRFPRGVIVGITPFNFPLNLVLHKVAPALASGNAIILKPAPQTPLTALALAELIQDVGVPAGLFQVLPCSNEVAQKLATHPGVDMLSFTGSAAVGWKLKALASEKKVVLELGGNAAMIVDSGCEWDKAVKRGVTGAFAYAGQICISVQRIFVHRPAFDSYVSDYLGQARNLPVGDPSSLETVVGPMITLEAAQRVESWVNEATGQGARALLLGKREGHVLHPTVLTNTNPEMKVWKEEIFGPVVLIEPFSEFEEALDMVNDSVYGLQAGVFTNDLKKVDLAFRELKVGGVIINEYPTFRVDQMPYGGVKRSGYGREGIRYAIEEMTEPRLLVVNPENPINKRKE